VLDDLLDAIVADPVEDRYAVLADWLEEHDDPRRAELLRLHRRLLATCCEPERHPERPGWHRRLLQLLAEDVRPCVPQRTVLLGRRAKLTLTFSFIPPGAFLMGSPPDEEGRADDEPLPRRVEVGKGFWLAVDPLTQGPWRWVMKRNPSSFKADHLPVHCLSWNGLQTFCNRLSVKVGQRFRLPDEQEWEWACRAGATTPFFFGQALSFAQANYSGSRIFDHMGQDVYRREPLPPGSYPPNAWGLRDMHGNVREWVSDRFEEGDDSFGVLRGGSWCSPMPGCRSAARCRAVPGTPAIDIGCRLVLCPDEPA
jgi:uncharacterized protein (TIGR02996 family)